MFEPSNPSRIPRRRRPTAPGSQAPISLHRQRLARSQPQPRQLEPREPTLPPKRLELPPSHLERSQVPPRVVRRLSNPASAGGAASTSPSADRRFNLKHLLFGKTPSPQIRERTAREGLARSPQGSASAPSLPPTGRSSHRFSGQTPAPLPPVRPAALTPRSPRSRSLHPVPAGQPTRSSAAALAPTVRTRRPKRVHRRPRPASPLLHITRLLILGVGVGAIAGTLMSALNPATRYADESSTVQEVAASSRQTLQGSNPNALVSATAALSLGQEITPLKAEIQEITAQYQGLTPGVFLADLDTGAYVDLNGNSRFSAASVIKIPILVAFLQDVDAGKIQLDDMLTMQAEDVAEGSGTMQYSNPGTEYTALETASMMITISDNTATNMLIRQMGGISALNQRFQAWGLTTTALQNPLPDLEGTNTTSSKELVELLALVNQGDLLSLRSRDRLLDIMRRTENNSLLPSGLDSEATIAHKTGDIGTLLGDAGIVDLPNGKRYLVAVMVQRPFNDTRAYSLIQEISSAIHEALSQPIENAVTTYEVEAEQPSGLNEQMDLDSDQPAAEATLPDRQTSDFDASSFDLSD